MSEQEQISAAQRELLKIPKDDNASTPVGSGMLSFIRFFSLVELVGSVFGALIFLIEVPMKGENSVLIVVPLAIALQGVFVFVLLQTIVRIAEDVASIRKSLT